MELSFVHMKVENRRKVLSLRIPVLGWEWPLSHGCRRGGAHDVAGKRPARLLFPRS